MTLIKSLDSAVNSLQNIVSQPEAAVDSVEKSDFGSLLDSMSSGADIVSSSLTTISDIEVLSLESIQNQLLTESGLESEDLLSQVMSDGTISEMQEALYVSLQTSMIQTPIDSIGSSGEAVLQSSVETVVSEATDAVESSNLVDEVYSYSFGEEGLDENDLFDSVNILNNIPIVSDIYQISTNTDVSPVSQLVGSMLYSGVLGMGVTALELGVDYFTGYSAKDLVASTGLVPSLSEEETDTQ